MSDFEQTEIDKMNIPELEVSLSMNFFLDSKLFN